MRKTIIISFDESEDFHPSAEFIERLIAESIRSQLESRGKTSWNSGYELMEKHNMKVTDEVEK